MKKISFRLILAALAATAALTACTKETTPPNFENDKVDSAAEGTRVIAVSFGPQTKTRLDGLTPKFADGDSILLVSWPSTSSSPTTHTCKVSVDDKGIATISTNLTGTLEAIYPAKYAWKDKKSYDVNILSVQTGRFRDANICGTQIKEGDESAVFTNLATLFIIDPPTGAQSLMVKSLKRIGDGGQRTGEKSNINRPHSPEDLYSISVPNQPDEDGKYYVAVATNGKDDVNLSDLSFEVEFETAGTGSIKGIPTSVIEIQAKNLNLKYEQYNTIVSGTAYTIDDSNWHEYVTVAERKWATMNVGAEKPEEAGDYFMWSEVRGHKYVSGAWTNFPETNPDESRYNSNLWTPSECFSGQNIPYVLNVEWEDWGDGQGNWVYTCSKYNDDDGSVKHLSLADDAANANWGGAWRMPKGDEAAGLVANYELKVIGETYGMAFGTSPNTIFLPASGQGRGIQLRFSGEPTISGCYWISESAGWRGGDRFLWFGCVDDVFGFEPCVDSNGYNFRYNGCNIRAIVDDSYSLPVVINTDTDKDGVIDEKDNCPNTPPEAKVDLQGCPLDSDGDGVPDYLDKCLGTSAEAIGKVDELGCPLDSDGDGVSDYLDKCPGTPAAAKGYVDDNGCPVDSDGDGVYDYEDACPSVAGIKENKGCPEVK